MSIGISFSYGFISSHFRIFPFEQIKSLKEALILSEAPPLYPPYYLHKKTFFEEHGIKADIVMIGDSITDGADWQELFPNITVVNRGIGGDTSAGILNRIDSIISTDANKAFIMIGINDLNRGLTTDEIFSNYQKIVNILISNSIIPIIQSTLFVGERLNYLNDNVYILNNKLKEFALAENIKFIDLNESLSVDGELNLDFSADDLHLNGKGYSAWKKEINSFLE